MRNPCCAKPCYAGTPCIYIYIPYILDLKSTFITGRAIGGSVQALIIGKSLNPSKLPYLDHYGLVEIKKFALEIIIFEIPLIQV